MTQVFLEDVLITGSADVAQLQVRANSSQSQPLQSWQNNGGTALARLTSTGRLHLGDLNVATGAALVEANATVTSAADPQRGVQAIGNIQTGGAPTVNWAYHELKFTGAGSLSGVQTALRSNLTNSVNAGSAELRAGAFEATTQSTAGTVIGVRGAVLNGAGTATKAIGIQSALNNDVGGLMPAASAFEVAPPVNSGTISTLYGLKVPSLSAGSVTNLAAVQLADEMELGVQSATPTRATPAGFIKVYPKLNAGSPRLYAKDAAGAEYDLTGTVGNYAANNVLLGNGTSPFQTVAPGNSGNVLRSNGTTWQSSAIQSGDLTSALAAPPAIGTTTPNSGVFNPLFVGAGGPRLKNSGGVVEVRSNDDSIYANLNVKALSAADNVSLAKADASIGATLSGSNGYRKHIDFQTNASSRWRLKANETSETGSSAGSDFVVERFDDSGTVIDSALTIYRASGDTYLRGNNLALTAPSGYAQIYLGGASAYLGIKDTSGAVDRKHFQVMVWDGQVVFRRMNDAGELIDNLISFPLSGTNPGAGKVLTSDSTGVATWQTLPASGSQSYPCQGRLTLTTGTPITTTDVTAATTLYFTPFNGNQVALYNGAAWVNYSFTERSLSLSGLAANSNYDLFLYDNAGTLTLEALAWTNNTTRATALALQDGIYVKSGALTRRYLGTMRTTNTVGQTEDSQTKRLIWNAYNRVPRKLKITDSTDSWTYSSTTYRPWNNSTTNRVELILGLNEMPVRLSFISFANMASSKPYLGIGLDSTSVNSGDVGTSAYAPSGAQNTSVSAHYLGYVGIGYHYLQLLEATNGVSTTFLGDDASANSQSGALGECLA